MPISADSKFLLNNYMGDVAKKVGLGDLIDSATSDTSTLPENQIFVGSASSQATAVALSGDATIVASGALTIANNAITGVKINAGAVTKAKLAAGISASHMVVFAAANVASVAGATNVVPVVGVLSTDLVFVTLRAQGSTPRTIISAVPAADQISVVFSGDPSTDHAFDYMVVRATT